MSEIKRVALNTLEPQVVSNKVTKKTAKTIRISVVLPESNEDECPEYNYKDELAAAKKRSKLHKRPNHIENEFNDPFGDDDDSDVRRIALEMEAKHGAKMTKKKKDRKDAYADIGMGYDESDSFIDNTDGYDEIIPQNVTTLHGGFYINCGALEFKTDNEASSDASSSSSEDNRETVARTVNRKRLLETSDDSDSESAGASQIEKKPKLQSSKNSVDVGAKKKLFNADKLQEKKRTLSGSGKPEALKKTVKDLLREKREDLNMSIMLEAKNENGENENNGEKDSLKENKKPMSITNITDTIESVVKQQGDADCGNNCTKQSVDDIHRRISLDAVLPSKTETPVQLEDESSQEGNKTEKSEAARLPENLPLDVVEIIDQMKRSALECKVEGKRKLLSTNMNSLLMSLDKKCILLGKSTRNRIFDHLAPFINCRRETFVRRLKVLNGEEEELRLRNMQKQLRDCIDGVMPNMLFNYEQESQKVLQKKFSKEAANSEENIKLPRRRFKWPDEAKKLLSSILLLKKRRLLSEGKQKESLEETIVQFLRKEILTIWPEGWMHLHNLMKYYTDLSDASKQVSENNNVKKKLIKQPSNLTITPVLNSKVGDRVDRVLIEAPALKEPVKELDITVVTGSSSDFRGLLAKTQAIASSVTKDDKNSLASSAALKRPVEGGVIVKAESKADIESLKKETNDSVIPKPAHCQVIDLTSNLERKEIDVKQKSLKFEGDDIQMVMENLKALQKLSSPVKSESTGSPVSVIAYNKTFSSMSSSGSTAQRTEFNSRTDLPIGFQEEFITSLQHIASTSASKSTYNGCS